MYASSIQVPTVLVNVEKSAIVSTVTAMSSMWNDFLPSPATLDVETNRWLNKWKSTSQELPATLQESLLQCDADVFPNMASLLRLACTVPVTTCENERSNSRLKLLKTYLRSTMGQDRLSGN